MDNEQHKQERKKQTTPAYSQRQAEDRLSHFKEAIPEMKHPGEMNNVLSITKDILESGFDVTEIHTMLAEKALQFAQKTLDEGGAHFVEEFVEIAKGTIANVQSPLKRISEISLNIALTKLEEGDVGLVRKFLNIGRLASDDNRFLEEKLESRLIQLSDEKLADDDVDVVETYLLIGKTIQPELTPQRQQISEKAIRLAERSFDGGKYEVTEKYIGVAAISGGDVTSSQEYLAKKAVAIIDKEMAVSFNQRNIELVRQLLHILSGVGGDSTPYETKLSEEFRSKEKAKTIRGAIMMVLIAGAIAGLIYGWFWWREQQKLARIEELRQEDIARDKAWQKKLATTAFGENLATFSGQNSGVTDVAISSDGKYVASVANDNSTKVWRLNDGILVQPPYFDYASALLSVAISPDDKILVHGSSKKIDFYNFLTGEPRVTVPSIDAHTDWVTTLAYSNDGKYLFSGSSDKLIKMWDANDGSLQHTFSGHSGAVMSVAITTDGNYLVSGSTDSTVRVWNIATESLMQTLKGQESIITSVIVTSDGNAVASGSENGKLVVWDNTNGKMLTSMMISPDGITSLNISANNNELISGTGSGEVVIWNYTAVNSQPVRWKLHQGSVTSVAVSENNGLIVSSGGDGDNKVIVTKYK